MDDSHFNFTQQKQKHHHLVSFRKTEVEKQLVIHSALKQNYSFKSPKSSFAAGMCWRYFILSVQNWHLQNKTVHMETAYQSTYIRQNLYWFYVHLQTQPLFSWMMFSFVMSSMQKTLLADAFSSYEDDQSLIGLFLVVFSSFFCSCFLCARFRYQLAYYVMLG